MTPQTGYILFGSEYEQALEVWIQKRFRYLCFAFIAFSLLMLVTRFARADFILDAGNSLILISGSLFSLVIVIYYLTLRNWRDASRDLILTHASRMILLLGGMSIVTQLILVALNGNFDGRNILPALFYWHFTACLFLPWTPRESLRPLLPLMTIWVIFVLAFGFSTNLFTSMITSVLGFGVLVPGWGICSWRLTRHSREFRKEMVGRHFLTMRQEFARARSIHESMFPKPYQDEHASFEYTYIPMRELGGDFIHLYVGAEGLIHTTLLDVTGHGLAAALTVNRLFGELERIRAELPLIEPDEVLILLNRYINLTMTRHNIYATAACVTLDPYLGELRWAAAGHPPGFLRRHSGDVVELRATTVVLGALNDQDFATDMNIQSISPGDELIMYTDGVFEARNRGGDMYGLNRLRELLRCQPAPRNWPQFITSAIQKYSAGRAEDDVLVASLRFISSRGELPAKDSSQSGKEDLTIEGVSQKLK